MFWAGWRTKADCWRRGSADRLRNGWSETEGEKGRKASRCTSGTMQVTYCWDAQVSKLPRTRKGNKRQVRITHFCSTSDATLCPLSAALESLRARPMSLHPLSCMGLLGHSMEPSRDAVWKGGVEEDDRDGEPIVRVLSCFASLFHAARSSGGAYGAQAEPIGFLRARARAT